MFEGLWLFRENLYSPILIWIFFCVALTRYFFLSYYCHITFLRWPKVDCTCNTRRWELRSTCLRPSCRAKVAGSTSSSASNRPWALGPRVFATRKWWILLSCECLNLESSRCFLFLHFLSAVAAIAYRTCILWTWAPRKHWETTAVTLNRICVSTRCPCCCG